MIVGQVHRWPDGQIKECGQDQEKGQVKGKGKPLTIDATPQLKEKAASWIECSRAAQRMGSLSALPLSLD